MMQVFTICVFRSKNNDEDVAGNSENGKNTCCNIVDSRHP